MAFSKYTRRESNPNLKNRNLPFYPLNYGCPSICSVSGSFISLLQLFP